MAKQGKGARDKGSAFERKTAKTLGAWWGHDFHRTPGSGSLHWGSSNNVAGDIVTPPEADFPYVIECKDHNDDWTLESVVLNKADVKNWWAQVVNDSLSVKKTPMLVFKRNRSSVFIMLPYIEKLANKLESMHAPFMISYVEFKDLQERPNRFKVIVFTQDYLTMFTQSFFRTLYSEEASWLTHSRMSDNYEITDTIKEKDYETNIDSILNKL